MADATLRIDKFLWFARLARTRSLAKQIAEGGHLRCDGRRIDRAHAVVRAGEVLSVPLPSGVRVLKIVSLPPRRVSAKDLPAVYETLAPQSASSLAQEPPHPGPPSSRPRGSPKAP